MKLQAYLLGRHFASSRTICIYFHGDNTSYMALDDVDLLTSIQSVDLLQRTFRQHPDHFVICDHQQRAYIMTNSAIHIARARNVLALAELCKLTLSEIHSGIATPLLRAIGIDVACPLGQPSETPVDVRHADRCPEFVPAKPFGAQRDLDDEEKRYIHHYGGTKRFI